MIQIDDVVRALRCVSQNVDQRYTECDKHEDADCKGCPLSWSLDGIVFSEMSFEERADEVCERAASLLESQEKELTSLQSALADLKDGGFCGSCTGCNAPHDPNGTTWCNDWEWRGNARKE